MLLQNDNIDLILFSSNIEQGAKSANSVEREKFTRWFSSFWDYGIADSGNQGDGQRDPLVRSEEHTSELQSLMRISYAVFCLKKKTEKTNIHTHKKSKNNNIDRDTI